MIRSLKVASLLAFTSIVRGNLGVIILTVFILVLVALNLLFVPGLLQGLVSSANDKLINTYSGDIIIESDEEDPLIREVDSLIDKIEAIDGVSAVSPRNSIGAEISFENERVDCIIYGIQPEREEKVFTIHESLIEGNYLDASDQGEILLGIQLAGSDQPNIELYSRSLRKVHAADEVSITYSNGLKKTYIVKGVFQAEFIQTDLQAFVSEKEFHTINPLARNGAASIHVKLAASAKPELVIERIWQIGDGLRILTWEDNAGIIRSMTQSFATINAILNAVNLLVAGITVFIVTYIDVNNKRRQIGIQRAIGITPYSITFSYLMRAIFYAIVGVTLASLIFTNGVIPLEARYPFHFPLGNVYLYIELPQMIRVALILLMVSIVAAFIPVRLGIRMKILDAIWG